MIRPSSGTIDRQDKFRQYEAAGVAHYWVLDPKKKSIEGYQIAGGKYAPPGVARDEESISLPPFNDLVIPLRQLWQPE